MKKLILPVLLAASLLLAACSGTGASPMPSPTGASPSPAVSATPAAASATAAPEESADESEAEDNRSTENGGENAGNASDVEEDEPQVIENVSIINGSSDSFYGLYITDNRDGNPGENIIGDTPLGEGEEIELPYIKSDSKELYFIVEDEEGVMYTSNAVSLAGIGNVELRLNNGSLEAIAG